MVRIQQSSTSSTNVQPPAKRSKKIAKTRKSPSAPTTDPDGQTNQPHVATPRNATDVGSRHRLISEAAYRFYAERGYTHGHDLDDWLRAEAAIDQRLIDSSPFTG
jgi:hypothetical protein